MTCVRVDNNTFSMYLSDEQVSALDKLAVANSSCAEVFFVDSISPVLDMAVAVVQDANKGGDGK